MDRRANGEGTIKKRSDGYYAVSLSDGKDADGMRVRHQATCKTKKEALARLEEWKAAKKSGVDIRKGDMTMSALIDLWMKTRTRIRATTRFSYQQQVDGHLKPNLGHHKVGKVTARILDDFLAERRAAGLGPASVAYLRRLLHTIFAQAVKYDIVLRNVVDFTAPIEESKFVAKFFTPDQARKLVAVLPDDDYGIFVLVCVALGMRPAEVRGLRWADIEMLGASGVVSVCQQIKDAREGGGGYLVQPPKSDKGIRKIPLPAVLVQRLRTHRKRQQNERETAQALELDKLLNNEWADLVFKGGAGLPLPERYTRRKFKQFLEAAGLDEDTRLYDCRHATNALLTSMGVAPEVRRDIMGHSTTLITMDTYGHAMPSARVAAMDMMNGVFASGRYDDDE